MFRIEKCRDDRSLIFVIDIRTDPHFFHFRDQKTVVVIVAFGARWDPSLFVQFLQCFCKCEYGVGRGSESPFAVFFHCFPLVVEIQGETPCFPLTCSQTVVPTDDKREAGNALNTFIGAAHDEIDPKFAYRDVHAAETGHSVYDHCFFGRFYNVCYRRNII